MAYQQEAEYKRQDIVKFVKQKIIDNAVSQQ